jgi:subtilisin family serine protease
MTLGLFDDAPAAFSATGPTLDAVAKPDLLAPGRRIVSFLQEGSTLAHAAPAENLLPGGLAFMSGTSFAAPQVAAAAAILLQAHPRWTPNQVKWALTRTSRRVARSGAGTLDLRAALRYAARPGNANSALPGATALPGFEAAAANAAVAGDTWSSNTWSSNTWSSNTWSSNTWSSNTWSSTSDAFTR